MAVIQPLFEGIHNKRFKTLLHMMGFSIHKVCLEPLEEVFFTNWDFEVLGKRQCCPKPTPHSTIHFMGHPDIDLSRR
jgi:hypothetical protein